VTEPLTRDHYTERTLEHAHVAIGGENWRRRYGGGGVVQGVTPYCFFMRSLLLSGPLRPLQK
jgi:hypothetical protein